MADKKIIDLTAIVTQSATDLSETSLNGAGSRKETRLQKDTYTRNFISSKQIATLATTTTITGVQVYNGEIKLNPADGAQLFTLPSKADLYSAMGSPPINSSVSCQIINISNFPATLVNSDFDIIGMPTLVIPKKSTFDLNFVVTNSSTAIDSVTVDSPGSFTAFSMSITGPGSGAVLVPAFESIAIAASAGGTGYTVNDIVQLVGGTYSIQAEAKVISVGGSGQILTVLLQTPGVYSVLPVTQPLSVTGGTGVNGMIATLFSLTAISVSSPGSGYTIDSAISFTVTGTTPTATLNILAIEMSILGGFVDTVGSGDFIGPASSINNDIVVFDGTTGKLGKDTGVSINRVTYRNSTKIEVDPLNGDDITGTGSVLNPYMTLSAAMASIADASSSKIYSILVNGATSEASLVFKPYVIVEGDSIQYANITITSITLHSDFEGGTDKFSGFENCNILSSFDLSLTTPPTGNSQFAINNGSISGTITGNTGLGLVTKNTVVSSNITLIDTGLTKVASPGFGTTEVTSSTVPVNLITIASPFIGSLTLNGNDATYIYDLISYKVPIVITGTPGQVQLNTEIKGINLIEVVDGASTGQFDFNNANVNNNLNLAKYWGRTLYVSDNGNDSNNGQIVQPLRHIETADTGAADGSVVLVAPMADTSTDFLKRSGVNLFGSSKEQTSLTSSNPLGIDDAQWIATTAPNFIIDSITLDTTTIDTPPTSYSPSVYIADSKQTFSNGKIIPDFNAGLVTDLVIRNQYLKNPKIISCNNLVLENCVIDGVMVLDGTDGSNVATYGVKISNCTFNGSITCQTGITGTPGNFNVEIINSLGISEFIYDDESVSITLDIAWDILSRPTDGVTVVSGGLITERYLEQFTPKKDINQLNIKWYGDVSELLYQVPLIRKLEVFTVVSPAFELEHNTEYLLQGSGVTPLKFPTSGADTVYGSTIRVIMSQSSSGFTIEQNAGNQVFFGSASSTSGAGGSVASIVASGMTVVEFKNLTSFGWIISNASAPISLL